VSAATEITAPLETAVADVRKELRFRLAEGVTVGKLVVMVAALVSLFIDQSFGAVYSTIQNYAGGTLGASVDELSWTNVGYNTCYYTVLLLTPWLIRTMGRRSVFGFGHLFFAVVTLYLSMTGSLHGFIIGRCIEGIAQGTFFVCSVATVLTLFPQQYRGYAFSVFSVTSLSAAASGSFLGGWFIDHEYWRGALALYALLAVIAGAIVATLLEAPEGEKDVPADWTGVALVFVAFFAYQYVSAYGERRDWLADGWILANAIVGIVAFVAFVYFNLRLGDRAFIRLSLFKISNLAVGSALGFGLGAPLFGANEFLLYAQQQLAFPPSTAGALLTLRIVAIVFVAPTAVLLVNANKINVKLPVAIGFVCVPASYALLAMQTTYASSFVTFAFALILSGAGFACLFSPIANVTVRSLPPPLSPQGLAIFKLMLLLGGSLAATALGARYDHAFDSYLSLLAGAATLHHLAQIGLQGMSASEVGSYVAAQASVLAYADSSKWVALAALINIPLIFLLKPPPKSA
jgi:DHA2 family multidrug resistance protein